MFEAHLLETLAKHLVNLAIFICLRQNAFVRTDRARLVVLTTYFVVPSGWIAFSPQATYSRVHFQTS